MKKLLTLLLCLLILSGCGTPASPTVPSTQEPTTTEPSLASTEPAPSYNQKESEWMLAPPPDTAVTGIVLEKTVFDLTATGLESDFNPGFILSFQTEWIQESEFTGAIQEVPAILRYQFENHDIFSSSSPSYYSKDFGTAAEAVAYLGYAPLRFPDWEAHETAASVSILGDSDGCLQYVSVQVQYRKDDLRMQGFASMYTEHFPDSSADWITTFSHVDPGMADSEFVYENAGRKHCLILRDLPTEMGYYGIDGYLIEGGVIYRLHVIYKEGQYEQAKVLLYEWLDLL